MLIYPPAGVQVGKVTVRPGVVDDPHGAIPYQRPISILNAPVGWQYVNIAANLLAVLDITDF